MKSLKSFGLVMVLALTLGMGAGCAKKNAEVENVEAAPVASTSAVDAAAQQITDGVVYFDFDKYDIKAEYRDMLQQKAELMKQFPSIRVRIEGNCDERGTQEYNLALGERRARAAYEYMIRLGVPPNSSTSSPTARNVPPWKAPVTLCGLRTAATNSTSSPAKA